MSVAFRRESDEEHLEPRFELPIPPGPNLVTPRGLDLINRRVAELEAALLGELSEDARKSVLRNARYWRSRSASAQLAPATTGEQVAIGARVTFERDGAKRTIDIVGHDESEPGAGRIAFTAPLVRPMLGAQVGDEIELADGQVLTIAAIKVAM